MTEPEFTTGVANGSIQAEAPDSQSGVPSAPPVQSVPISQFIPLLTQLQSVQLCVSSAPTYIPQTFQDQIVFVFDGSDYFLYLYFNNQWNEFAVSGGGGSGVDQILAGTGISISPGGGTGNVTITCTIDDATLPMSNITTNDVSTSQHGFAPKLPNDATKYLDGTGAYSTPSGGGGGSFAIATGTISDITLTGFTVGAQNDDTVVTHGLGTTPKLITVSINNFQVPGSNNPGLGTQLQAILCITFDASGTNVSGFSNYFVVSSSTGPLHSGGNSTSWTNSGSQTSGNMQLELISVGSTTFTFRISYSLTNASSFLGATGYAQGISWLALG
jgi:hypothetical protein